jgi:hypothetical protein
MSLYRFQIVATFVLFMLLFVSMKASSAWSGDAGTISVTVTYIDGQQVCPMVPVQRLMLAWLMRAFRQIPELWTRLPSKATMGPQMTQAGLNKAMPARRSLLTPERRAKAMLGHRRLSAPVRPRNRQVAAISQQFGTLAEVACAYCFFSLEL